MLLISDFIREMLAHVVMTSRADDSPPENQYGYVMGSTGQIATLENLTSLAKDCYPAEWEKRLARSKKWIGHEIYDCNGIFEGYIKKKTGVNVNTRALNNYASWCDIKSDKHANKNLTNLPQYPGVALFCGENPSSITHVGHLLFKYGPGYLDWYVAECRGVDYGYVARPLKEANWSFWGVMTKFFTYDVGTEDFPNYISKIPKNNITPESPKADIIWAQDKLNWNINANLLLDGEYGQKTKDAYALYASKRGWNVKEGAIIGPTGRKSLSVGNIVIRK